MLDWKKLWKRTPKRRKPNAPSELLEVLRMQQVERLELLARMAEKDRQIGMVLESKFESRPVHTQDAPTPNVGGVMSPESLMDVLPIDDDREFIKAISQ